MNHDMKRAISQPAAIFDWQKDLLYFIFWASLRGPNSGEAFLHQGLFSYMKVCQRKKRTTENEKKTEVIFEILFPILEILMILTDFYI